MPDRNDITIAAASAAVPAPTAPDIIGYLVQCETCPQKALVACQPQPGWVCPRCAEVVDVNDSDQAKYTPLVETGHDIGLTHAAEMFPQHQRPGWGMTAGADLVISGAPAEFSAWRAPEPCAHQDVRYGVCADCGEYPNIGGVTA